MLGSEYAIILPRYDGCDAESSIADLTLQFTMWSRSAPLRSSGQYFDLVRLIKLKTERPINEMSPTATMKIVSGPPSVRYCSRADLGDPSSARSGVAVSSIADNAIPVDLKRFEVKFIMDLRSVCMCNVCCDTVIFNK